MAVFLIVLVLGLAVAGYLFVGLMPVIWALVIGFIAGAVAKLLMPGRDPGGFLITALLGIGGALAATLMGRLVGFYQPGQNAGFIASVIGAFVLLLVYRLFARSRGYAHF